MPILHSDQIWFLVCSQSCPHPRTIGALSKTSSRQSVTRAQNHSFQYVLQQILINCVLVYLLAQGEEHGVLALSSVTQTFLTTHPLISQSKIILPSPHFPAFLFLDPCPNLHPASLPWLLMKHEVHPPLSSSMIHLN